MAVGVERGEFCGKYVYFTEGKCPECGHRKSDQNMAVGVERGEFCGKYVYFTEGKCPECGHAKPDPINIFAEEAEQPSTQAVAVQKSLPYPTAWMFIWSTFNPILQWILVGAYVANGETEYAWKLLIKPVIAQIIIAVIVFIILFAISEGGF